jgi:hypothetical protein
MTGPYIRRSDGTTLEGRTVRAGTDWSLTLRPCDLTYIVIDHSISLTFDDAVVRIANPFVLRSDGVVVELDPGDRASLGPLLALYPDTLAYGSVTSTGILTLGFRSGATIEVPPCPSYEAWQVAGPDEYLVVCDPGTEGLLSVWP